MRFDRARRLLTLLAVCLVAGGCLRKETTPTLYLDPDGSVTWTVLEREVRSDERDPAARAAEERPWLEAVRKDGGALAEALRQLGGRRVRTSVLRDERPYSALTEARFPSIRRVLEDLLEGLGLDADVDLETEGSGHRLTVSYDPEPVFEIDENDPLLALLDGLERSRIVLTAGRFVEADGLTLDETATIARLVVVEGDAKRRVLSLAWEE